MSNLAPHLIEKRREAEAWVNGYTATAAGIVMVTTPIPGGATAALCSLEATMCYQIGLIYRGDVWTLKDAASLASVIGLASVVGKIAALEAAILLGPFAFLARPVIAATIIRSLGQMIIKHFESQVY